MPSSPTPTFIRFLCKSWRFREQGRRGKKKKKHRFWCTSCPAGWWFLQKFPTLHSCELPALHGLMAWLCAQRSCPDSMTAILFCPPPCMNLKNKMQYIRWMEEHKMDRFSASTHRTVCILCPSIHSVPCKNSVAVVKGLDLNSLLVDQVRCAEFKWEMGCWITRKSSASECRQM